MVAACETWQTELIPAPRHAELILANVARWSDIRDAIVPMDPAVYTTWCDRCECDHGSIPREINSPERTT